MDKLRSPKDPNIATKLTAAALLLGVLAGCGTITGKSSSPRTGGCTQGRQRVKIVPFSSASPIGDAEPFINWPNIRQDAGNVNGDEEAVVVNYDDGTVTRSQAEQKARAVAREASLELGIPEDPAATGAVIGPADIGNILIGKGARINQFIANNGCLTQ
ncbi:MAG TPA: hypothetical protein VGS08_01180 [Candidatus Saccharimonadales bacterium]|nr:hypothetical protein [Candidatus Saccharimonadales bacterium]